MIKYIVTGHMAEVKYKDRYEIDHGCCFDFDGNTQYPKDIKNFDNEDDACKELENYNSNIGVLSDHGMTYYLITEYYVIKYRCDDDNPDKYLENLGICAFAEWNEPSQELINSWK